MLKLAKKNVKLVLTSVFLILITYFIKSYFFDTYNGDLELGYSFLCIYASIVFFFLLYCSVVQNKGLVNVYSCVLVMSFLFFFGQHLVVLFGKGYVLRHYYRSILDGRIPNAFRLVTGYYVLIALLFLNIGVLVSIDETENKNQRNDIEYTLYNESVSKTAWLILIVVTIPTLYKYYLDAINTLTFGYDESLNMSTGSTIQNICYFLSYFFFACNISSFYLIF